MNKKDWIECPVCREKRFIRVDTAGVLCRKCNLKQRVEFGAKWVRTDKISPFAWDHDPYETGQLPSMVTANMLLI